jgi:hypothetical protein
MKRTIQHHSDKWFGVILTDTTDDPTPPTDGGAPPPEPEFGTEPPIHTEIVHPVVTFNIQFSLLAAR